MKRDPPPLPFVIYDDREWVAERLSQYTGVRRYGEVRVRGRSLVEHFTHALSADLRERLAIVNPGANLDNIWSLFPALEGNEGVLVIAARGAVADQDSLRQVLSRMPYSERAIVERRRHALFRFFPTVETFQEQWEAFRKAPLHLSPEIAHAADVLSGDSPLRDIGELSALLEFIAGATPARSFNHVGFDEFTYKKRSINKAKMRAEHDYYGLIPQSMRPWMAGAFDYRENETASEYTMLRYSFADAAFQWVHNAWNKENYDKFLSNILFFLRSRPSRKVDPAVVEAAAKALFIDKVVARREQLLANPVGRRLIDSLSSSPEGRRAVDTFDEYLALAQKQWRRFGGSLLVIGHGDPCLSNILYDPPTSTVKLIDPTGAVAEDQLWTHPLYDYCKLSHSILGDYDFINNMVFEVVLDDQAEHAVSLKDAAPPQYKDSFERRVAETEDLTAVRLGEVSLFLSMLPLHIDHPTKVLAFLLRARSILDRVKKDL